MLGSVKVSATETRRSSATELRVGSESDSVRTNVRTYELTNEWLRPRDRSKVSNAHARVTNLSRR